ncbi:MAG TPA: hypothetical protein VL325_09805, partial [Pyrinomonadaceae bacterium]|nr:hypothetical protein [Pyrinomonadaceae bacterium]
RFMIESKSKQDLLVRHYFRPPSSAGHTILKSKLHYNEKFFSARPIWLLRAKYHLIRKAYIRRALPSITFKRGKILRKMSCLDNCRRFYKSLPRIRETERLK